VFAGVPLATTDNGYVSFRVDGEGWSTVPSQPPFPKTGISDFSSSLEYSLAIAPVLDAEGEITEAKFLLHRMSAADTIEGWDQLGENLKLAVPESLPLFTVLIEGGSGDLCHVVVEAPRLLLEAPVGNDAPQLYDVSRGCGGEAEPLRLVAVRNSDGLFGESEPISSLCNPALGVRNVSPVGEASTSVNAVSGDGGELFFTVNVERGAAKSNDCGRDAQLFVRLGGERTVEVSRPLVSGEAFGGCGDGVGEVPGEVPCPGAVGRSSVYFRGASEDGSRVFFTTQQGLVSGDTDGKNDLYMASIGCPEGGGGCAVAEKQVTSLVRVSEDPNVGQAAEVFGVVGVASNGDAVYFVAHGVLTNAANSEGDMPVEGAANLYVYDSETGKVMFVAGLCSGVEQVHCPRGLTSDRNDKGLWDQEGEAQVSGDGRFLVFTSYGQLVRRFPQADTDGERDLYRFDMGTGVLDRVSLGEAGYHANGNGENIGHGFDVSIPGSGLLGGNRVFEVHRMGSLAVSGDGSWVVFSSAERLSAHASNGLANVYVWHEEPGWSEGVVSLVSSGNSLTHDFGPVIDPSGRDVFFMSTAGMVLQDTEKDIDIYDARIGGGFPPVSVERIQCSSDACQGSLTNPAPLVIPGSVSQAPGQNFKPLSKKKAVVKKKKRKTRSKAKGKVKAKGRARKGGVGVVSSGGLGARLSGFGRGGS
jgi:hypothetical protein